MSLKDKIKQQEAAALVSSQLQVCFTLNFMMQTADHCGFGTHLAALAWGLPVSASADPPCP